MSSQIFSYSNNSKFDQPEIFVSGNNDLITNKNGKTYVDCNSGLWNVNFGYNNPHFKITVPDLQFYPTHFWSSTEATELAAKQICDHFGYDKVFFGHSGSDAIESAIYISRYCTNRPNVLAYKSGYHGSNLQAHVLDTYQDLLASIDYNTSAVLIEPLMITKGVIEFDVEVLKEIFTLKTKYNFHIIFDETVTALGRADYSFKWKPDILIASKGLTNGVFPLSAVLVSEKIGSYIKKTDQIFSHGYTMSGHPIACDILCKTISLLNKTNIDKQVESFEKLFNSLKLKYINKGMVFGIPVKDGILAKRQLQKTGYLIRQHNNILIFMPMLTSNLQNYINFAEVVTTFQEYDH